MTTALLLNFLVDRENKKINVERIFEAPLELVWSAWTESEILDQWWAPKPWRAETKSMNFTEGGRWLYAMVSPEGEKHWSVFDFKSIIPNKSFSGLDAFCDEHANIIPGKPRAFWKNVFNGGPGSTTVNIEIHFDELSDLEALIQMGFKEGFTMGMENLDHYISTQFKLRKQNKKGNIPRVTTYLNFPGNTEEAFTFYKKVFNGEFTGAGLQRFGDIEMPAGTPVMSEADKKLIIHAELTILAGHVLMATDAPESMGLKVEYGNNMHINIEPGSRAETEKLFKELSEGGKVSIPLQDMFWGAYFASFTDKYGINWMLNYQTVN